MEGLLNMMRREAQKAMAWFRGTELGEVVSYDSSTYSVKVLIGAQKLESGWLQLCAPAAGPGWGIFCPPSIGDLVDVHFVQGDLQAGFVSQRLFQLGWIGANKVPSGEYWLINKAGAVLKMLSDGSITLREVGGKMIVLATAGTAITGPLSVSGLLAAAGITATSFAVSGATTTAAITASGAITAPVVSSGNGFSGAVVIGGHTVTVVNGIVTSIA